MLELTSNTIKVLGVFGRLTPELEQYFDSIENTFSQKPKGDEYNVFRHLTLTFTPDATIADVQSQLELLRDIKQFLPVKLKINKLFIKNEESLDGAEHIAIDFGLEQTKKLVEFVKDRVGESAVATWYIKVVWFVPKKNQAEAIKAMSDLKKIEFSDFYLVSNKQSEENTLFKSTDFIT